MQINLMFLYHIMTGGAQGQRIPKLINTALGTLVGVVMDLQVLVAVAAATCPPVTVEHVALEVAVVLPFKPYAARLL
jgi:hypothetical protein